MFYNYLKNIIISCLLLSTFSLPCFSKDIYRETIVNYDDVVSNIEMQIYSKEYNSDIIAHRIDRLEKSIYGKTFSGSYEIRLNHLINTLQITKDKRAGIKKQVILDLLENRYLGASFSEEPFESRLSRLEQTVFGKVYLGNADERFQNLIKNIPMSVIGVSVVDSSNKKVSIKPELNEIYNPVEAPHYSFNKVDQLQAYGSSPSSDTPHFSSAEPINNISPVELVSDYFDKITVYSGNKVSRWNDTPVFIYVSPTISENNLNDIKSAIKIWDDYFSLHLINDVSRAQIVIDSASIGGILTRPAMNFYGSNIEYQVIISCGQYSNQPFFERFIAHELGHAIGIWGHSDNPNDIMYNYKEIDNDIAVRTINKDEQSINTAPSIPSKRDIKTLKKIYQSPSL